MRETLTETYGEFHIEPFERGFGHTVGNSLRRILLSSLEGSAVTKIKFQGVQDEFATIPGMVEDITDLVLNLKLLVIKNHSETPGTIRIARDRRGVVTAADILRDESIEIINPDHILCTLTDDIPFVVEMTVENGRGYRPAAQEDVESSEVGTIAIDATFSPVTRVEYRIADTRVGQLTNYDKLILKIWTTGTIGPEMALVEAAKILRKHLNPFLQYYEAVPGPTADSRPAGGFRDRPADAELERKLGMSLAELELSVRATNCLESEGITTVRDLVSRNEDQLLQVRNFGETTLKEVRAKLHEIGLDFRSEPGTYRELEPADDPGEFDDFGGLAVASAREVKAARSAAQRKAPADDIQELSGEITETLELSGEILQSVTLNPTVVLERLEGFVDQVEGNLAYVTLRSENGETLYGEYSAAKLAETGIAEQSRFVCKTIKDGDSIRVEIAPVVDEPIGDDEIRGIHEMIDNALGRNDSAVEY
jgi:DNA-directed RNA polymerase subunit alpha